MQQTRASTSNTGGFVWRLEGGATAVVDARRAFEDWLRSTAVDDETVHDMAVVLSELASNATLGARPGSVGDVRAWLDGGDVRLEVRNLVDEGTDVERWDLDDPLRGGGRGLLIVRAYTDTMEIDSAGGAVTVRCARRIGTGP